MISRYTHTAIFLHWLVALALAATFALGFYMADLPLSPNKLKLYSWHKWAGVTLLAVVVIRLAWRLTHRPPEFPPGMSHLAQLAAHTGHWVLYALMLLIPVSGWLMSSAAGRPVVWFGVLQLPDLIGVNKDLAGQIKEVHETAAWLLLVLVGLHTAAALKHHFVDKDSVLARMLPFLKK